VVDAVLYLAIRGQYLEIYHRCRGFDNVPAVDHLLEESVISYTPPMETTIKAVIMHGFTAEEAFAIMRAAKALGHGSDSTAYATTTQANLGWTVEELIEHLGEEAASLAAARNGRN